MNQTNIEIANNQINNTAANENRKISISTLIQIILGVISFSFLAFLFINQVYNSNDFDVFEKQALPRNLGHQYNQVAFNKGVQEGQYEQSTILNELINLTYQGNWTSIALQGNNETLIGSMPKGESDLRFMIGKDSVSQENVLIMIIKCLEGKHIDHWKLIHAFIPINKLSIKNHQDSIQLKGMFSAIQGNRKIFKQMAIDQKYESNITMTLLKDSDGLIDNSLVKIEYTSSSGFETELSLKATENTINDKINFYLFLTSTTATISMIINFYLIKMLSQAEGNIKSISLSVISINAIWDAYCCVINLSFAFKHPTFFLQFIIPTGLFFALFILVDIHFLYYYWRIKKRIVAFERFQKKKYVFYFFYYLGLCIAFNFLYDFVFSKDHIMLLPILLWAPQIIHNIRVNNDITLPLVYTVFQTISRMILPLYFKSYSGNWLKISNDADLLFNIAMITLGLFIVMGCQAVLGARFFLPEALRRKKNEEIYYYSNEDAMKKFPQLFNEDCVICLSKLFETDASSMKESDDDIKITIPSYQKDKEPTGEIMAWIMSVALGLLLDFHEWKFKSRKHKLPFMATQCNHVFHSDCLEAWLRRMKKCPSCRKEVSVIPI